MVGLSPWWAGALAGLIVAVFAGWRDHARKRRDDLDRVSLFNWPTVQVLALIVLAICASIAAKG